MTPKDSFFNPQCSSLPTHRAIPHFIRDIIWLLFIVNPRGKKLPFILGEKKGGTNFLCLSFPRCKKGDACMVVSQIIWNVLCFYFLSDTRKTKECFGTFFGRGGGGGGDTPKTPKSAFTDSSKKTKRDSNASAISSKDEN